MYEYIEDQEEGFLGKTGRSIKDFHDFSEKRFFSKKIEESNTFKLSINVNNEKIQKSNELSQCVSAGIRRSNKEISISENSYHYTVGASSSIIAGNRYAYIHSPKTTKMNTYKGKRISMYSGTKNSVNHITNNKSCVRTESYDIKDFTGEFESINFADVYLSATILVKEFVKTSSQIAIDAHYYGGKFALSIYPIKGHFTISQQICSFVYGDFVKYENLFRIFATTHTFSDKNATRKCNDTVAGFVTNNITTIANARLSREEAANSRQVVGLSRENAVNSVRGEGVGAINEGDQFRI